MKCNINWFRNNQTSQCVISCPNHPRKMYGDPDSLFCVSSCPAHLYGNGNTNLCGLPAACQSGFFADNSTNMCVSRCPADQSTFGDSTSRTCVQTCP